jgi:uncharacterized protein YkwD
MIRRSTLVIALVALLAFGAACAPRSSGGGSGGGGASPASVTLLGLVNAQRAAAGLPGLIWCPPLERSAQGHANDQAIHSAMTHIGSDGTDLAYRVARAGYFGWSAVGENIAANWPSGETVMAAWMASPGHRANILSPSYTYFGAGVGWSPNGTTYWTQDFGRGGGC